MENDGHQQKRLADLCDSIDYGFTTSAKPEPVGPKFLRITDIVGSGIDWSSVPFCRIEPKKKANYLLHPGDIVIARTGATTGHSAYLSDVPDAIFASYLVRLKIREPHSGRFVAYYLKGPQFWNYMYGVLGDKSAQPNASATTLTQAPIDVPPPDDQRRIADILGKLDDKIELNRRMNRTLEKMAAALFKSWFIDFDPVHAKTEGCDTNLPADIAGLFPDTFEESALGPIPKGWTVKPLDEIADYLNGLACQKHPPVEGLKSLPVIKIRELRQGITSNTDRASVDVPSKYVVEDGDVLFSWSGSLLVSIWCGGRGILNQHVFKVTSVSFPKWYCYQVTKYHLDEFQRIASDKATTMGHIKRHHLTDAKMAVPGEALMAKGTEILGTILDRRINILKQARGLAMIRDRLLPTLLSGEIELPTTIGGRTEEVA